MFLIDTTVLVCFLFCLNNYTSTKHGGRSSITDRTEKAAATVKEKQQNSKKKKKNNNLRRKISVKKIFLLI